MKKSILFLLAILVGHFSYGQTQKDSGHQDQITKPSGLTSIEANPSVFIIVDSKRMKLDTIDDYDIKPKWIESVSVLKDDISKQIYGNQNGVILIYTKKKYRKKVLKEIRA